MLAGIACKRSRLVARSTRFRFQRLYADASGPAQTKRQPVLAKRQVLGVEIDGTKMLAACAPLLQALQRRRAPDTLKLRRLADELQFDFAVRHFLRFKPERRTKAYAHREHTHSAGASGDAQLSHSLY